MSDTQKNDLSEFDLEARDTGSSSGYCFVHARRRDNRETIPTPPPSFEIENDGAVEEILDFEDGVMTVKIARPDFEPPSEMPEEPALASFREYHDPDLCSCEHMQGALSHKSIIVVVNGPISLPPALYTEEAMMSGRVSTDSIERPYDGRQWAFRFCPFEETPVRLLDDQVPMPEILRDGLACCRTMEQAVTHGRVELPPPDKHDRLSSKFTSAERSGTLFQVCPWCAEPMIDLGIQRLKRHLKTRKP